MKKIDIIVPFYNAKEHILQIFENNLSHLIMDKKIENFRIILVNDGSSNKDYLPHIERYKVLFSDNFLFVDLPQNKGKGGAIKEGVKHSNADIVAFYDIDFPFGIKALYNLYEALQNDETDVVISIRDSSYIKKLPFKRKIISQFVKTVSYILSKGKIRDSQAGLKGMKHSVAPILIETKSNSFIMDFEFLLKVVKRKLKIKEIVVTPNENIEFTNFSNATLSKEIKNLFRVLFCK